MIFSKFAREIRHCERIFKVSLKSPTRRHCEYCGMQGVAIHTWKGYRLCYFWKSVNLINISKNGKFNSLLKCGFALARVSATHGRHAAFSKPLAMTSRTSAINRLSMTA